MELKNLYTFKKIIEKGSYLKAAEFLNYSQSTITFQMKQLEKELNIKLFEKKENKMSLSKEGKKILPYINKIIFSIEELYEFVEKDNRELCGNLNIGVPESLLTYKIQNILKEFKELAPKIELSIKVLNCYEIYNKLISNDIDIAIHYNLEKNSDNITTIFMEKHNLCLIANPNISDKDKDFISKNQIKNLSHIENDKNAKYLKIFNNYLKYKNIKLNTPIELWSIESIKKVLLVI